MKLRPRWKDLAVSFLKMLENWLRLQDGIPQNIFAIAIPTSKIVSSSYLAI